MNHSRKTSNGEPFNFKVVAGEMVLFLFMAVILVWPLLLYAWWPLLIGLPVFIGFGGRFILKRSPQALQFILPVFAGVSIGLAYGISVSYMPPSSVPYSNGILDRNVQAVVMHNLQTLRFYPFIAPLFALLGTVLGYAMEKKENVFRWAGIVMVTLIVASFFYVGLQLNVSSFAEAVNVLPQKSYSFDGQAYDNAVHYMKRGISFYPAITKALNNRARPSPLNSVLNIRPPFLFYLWAFLPGDPSFIALLYMVLGGGFLFVVYLVAHESTGSPFIAAAGSAFCGYLLTYGIASGFYTFSEYWAWFFLAGALLALQRERHLVFIVLLTLCVMSREVFIFHWGMLVIGALAARDRKMLKSLGWVLAVCVVYYWIHFTRASGFILHGSGSPRFNLAGWFNGSPAFGIKSLLFGGQLLIKPLVFLVLVVIFHLGALVKIIIKKSWQALPMALVPLAGAAFLWVGFPGLYYWGLFYLPAFGFTLPALVSGEVKGAGLLYLSGGMESVLDELKKQKKNGKEPAPPVMQERGGKG